MPKTRCIRATLLFVNKTNSVIIWQERELEKLELHYLYMAAWFRNDCCTLASYDFCGTESMTVFCKSYVILFSVVRKH